MLVVCFLHWHLWRLLTAFASDLLPKPSARFHSSVMKGNKLIIERRRKHAAPPGQTRLVNLVNYRTFNRMLLAIFLFLNSEETRLAECPNIQTDNRKS